MDVGGFGEEGLEDGEVLWGDEDGDGEAPAGEDVGEVEEGDHVALCRVREDEDVCVAGDRHGLGFGFRFGLRRERSKSEPPFPALCLLFLFVLELCLSGTRKSLQGRKKTSCDCEIEVGQGSPVGQSMRLSEGDRNARQDFSEAFRPTLAHAFTRNQLACLCLQHNFIMTSF